MTGNGTRPPPTPSSEAPPPGPGQASSLAPSSATVESSTEGAPPAGPTPPPATSHPRVIRISHQSVEPVVMMHMNIQGEQPEVWLRARDVVWGVGLGRGCFVLGERMRTSSCQTALAFGLRVTVSVFPCPDSATQPGGVPSAPTGPLGPPGHGQSLGKSEGIRAGCALAREGVGLRGGMQGSRFKATSDPPPRLHPHPAALPAP